MVNEKDQCAGAGVEMNRESWESRIERLVDSIQTQRGESGSPLTLENIEDAFTYQRWSPAQEDCGAAVRDVLVLAAKQVLRSVPPGRLRQRALDCLIDARMLANAGITFRGRF